MRKIIYSFYLIVLLLWANPLSITAQIKIKMQKEGGVYTLPCSVNGLKLRFILDTGASDVSISLSEASFMLKNGYLDAIDIKGSSYAQVANGTYVSNTRIILKEINIGGVVLKNIDASIIETADAPLLLGQSALQKIGPYQINGDELWILNSDGSNNREIENHNIDALRKDARMAYGKGLYNVAISKYEQLAKISSIDDNETYNLAIAYYYTGEYSKSVNALKAIENATLDWSNSARCNYYQWIGIAYGNIQGSLQEAIFYYQKAELIASSEKDIY